MSDEEKERILFECCACPRWAADEIERLTKERDEARAALEPFAKVEPFDVVDGVWSHRGDGSAQILTEDDFKRARATAGVK